MPRPLFKNNSALATLGVSALLMLGAAPACCAAQLYVGPRTCTQQLDNCIDYRRTSGPFGSEGLCATVFIRCMKCGVWDARTVFPYGGVRMTGMIRR
jgi:hypothetical protein